MDEQNSPQIVEEVIRQLNERRGRKKKGIPIGISARHCHLNERDLVKLFGEGYPLTKKVDLLQPGEFASNETVIIVGPKGSIENVRVLGPLRRSTQVEVSRTDAFKLGLNPPVRESGNLRGSSPVTIVGPKGSIYLDEGLIIAQSHIHMSPRDADDFQLQDGEYVTVEVDHDRRPILFKKVRVRVSQNYRLEMHIDTDEANAGFVKHGQYGKLLGAGKYS